MKIEFFRDILDADLFALLSKYDSQEMRMQILSIQIIRHLKVLIDQGALK